MVDTILVFVLVVFDSIVIFNLVMPKIISISMSPPGTGAKVKGCFYECKIYVVLRSNIYLLKNMATILFCFAIPFTLSDLKKAYNKNNI